jgi:flagellar basal body rod protein FlgB
MEETVAKPVVQSRIADDTQITDQNTMEENQRDGDTVDMEEEQIQVSSDD